MNTCQWSHYPALKNSFSQSWLSTPFLSETGEMSLDRMPPNGCWLTISSARYLKIGGRQYLPRPNVIKIVSIFKLWNAEVFNYRTILQPFHCLLLIELLPLRNSGHAFGNLQTWWCGSIQRQTLRSQLLGHAICTFRCSERSGISNAGDLRILITSMEGLSAVDSLSPRLIAPTASCQVST